MLLSETGLLPAVPGGVPGVPEAVPGVPPVDALLAGDAPDDNP